MFLEMELYFRPHSVGSIDPHAIAKRKMLTKETQAQQQIVAFCLSSRSILQIKTY